MPWKPSTDFEEEIVNLQPDHDFIFGALSEPEPQTFYPRPQLHIEYAASKKRLSKKQQEEYETTGRFNDRLHVISQVQRIARTKPLGEQPTVNDWDNDKDAEKEVVAMMRHFGLGPSIEEPINDKVTIATYPTEKGLQVMQNGRKKVPLVFNDNLFKLQPKASNSSSFESDSNIDEMLSFNEAHKHDDTNADLSSSSCDTNLNSFHSGNNLDVSKTSNVSPTEYNKAQVDRHTLLLQAERMHQYGKLQEELEEDDSTNTSQSFSQQSSCYDQYSFRTALNDSVSSTSDNRSSDVSLNPMASEFVPSCQRSYIENNNFSLDEFYDSSSLNSSDTSYGTSSSFLQRFVKSDTFNDCGTSIRSFSSSSPILAPPTYASTLKKSVDSESPVAVGQHRKATPINGKTKSTLIQPSHLQFYTAREIYERKRHALQ